MGIVKRIRNLEIQGAINIAVHSLKHLKKFAKNNGFGSKFDKECKKLLESRPTAVAFFNIIAELKKDKSIKKIDELLKKIKEDEEKIAEKGSVLIKNGYRIHTHCHSSKAIDVIKKAAEKKRFTVIVDVTRPRKQGIKTAKELSGMKNIKVVLIADNAAGLALSPPGLPMDNIVLVGSDSIRKQGVTNKIGTYLLAVAAKEQRIPFYVAASTLKYDRRKKFVIEERDPSEVYKKIKNVKIRNPAFDITPWRYITAVITEEGIKKPRQVLKELRR